MGKRVALILAGGCLLSGCNISPEPAPVASVASLPASPTPAPLATAPPTVQWIGLSPATASLGWPVGGATPSVPFTASVTMTDGSTSDLIAWSSANPQQVAIATVSDLVLSATLGPSPVPGTYQIAVTSTLNPAMQATAAVTIEPGPLSGSTGS